MKFILVVIIAVSTVTVQAQNWFVTSAQYERMSAPAYMDSVNPSTVNNFVFGHADPGYPSATTENITQIGVFPILNIDSLPSSDSCDSTLRLSECPNTILANPFTVATFNTDGPGGIQGSIVAQRAKHSAFNVTFSGVEYDGVIVDFYGLIKTEQHDDTEVEGSITLMRITNHPNLEPVHFQCALQFSTMYYTVNAP